MPYIKEEHRARHFIASTPGELNYDVTKLCHEYIISLGGISYKNINEVIGVLECAKLELYRVLAGPYEDEKKKENGHITELDK